MELLRNRIWGFLVFSAFTLVNVIPAYALNVKAQINEIVKIHTEAKKDYQQDVAIYLNKVLPQLSKEDREFIIGLHQKYYAEKAANPEFIPMKSKGDDTILFGKNSEAALKIVNLEKGEFLINSVPFTYNKKMPLKYNHTVVVEILKSSKSDAAWNLVPSAHALFENFNWGSALIGAGIVGVCWWLFGGSKSGEKVKDTITPANQRNIKDLEKKVDELEDKVHSLESGGEE